jgi:hypothetical protein
MQGQMHVHAPDLGAAVPVLAHFFRQGSSTFYWPVLLFCHLRNRLSTG